MKILIFAIFIITFNVSAQSRLSGEKGNGADAFELGNTIKIWDVVEYGEPIDPTDFPEVYHEIKNQLNRFKEVLPLTGEYLNTFFEDSRPMWWLVEPELKDVENGRSNLKVLSYKTIQAAINSGGLIQINKYVWNRLSVKSKAYLMLHEVLWTANEYLVNDPTRIRALTGVIMNPHINKQNNKNLANIIFNILFSDNKLTREIYRDLGLIPFNGTFIREPFKNCKVYKQKLESAYEVLDGTYQVSCPKKSGWPLDGPGTLYVIRGELPSGARMDVASFTYCNYVTNDHLPRALKNPILKDSDNNMNAYLNWLKNSGICENVQ